MSSKFISSVIKLAGGTAGAQGIYLISLPLLTRLYSPEDFGVLAVFTSLVAVCLVIGTARYEDAIIACRNIKTAHYLVGLIHRLSLISSFVVMISGIIYTLFFSKDIYSGLILSFSIALSLFLNSTYLSIYYLNNKLSNYNVMTKGKLIAAVTTAGVSILFGYLPAISSEGLIFGILAGLLVNNIYLRRYGADILLRSKQIQVRDLYAVARLFSHFPRYLIVSSFIDRLSSQLHVLVFSHFFGDKVAGSIGLHNRVVSLPISIIGRSIGDVFKRTASECLKERGSCIREFTKVTFVLFSIASPITFVLYYFAPILFVFIFGPEWEQAGEFSSILAFNFLFAFVVSPVSCLIYLESNQKYDLILQSILFVMLTLGMGFSVYSKDLMLALYSYSGAYIIKYIVEFSICFNIAKGNGKE